MSTQAHAYNPTPDYQGVRKVENATSRLRAHCGQDIGGGECTFWWEFGEDPVGSAPTAHWSWESTSSKQAMSTTQLNSPFQSSSSQSSHEEIPRTSQEEPAGGRAMNSARASLVATLQTCLTALPSASAAASTTSPPPRQSAALSGGATSSGPSAASGALGPVVKPSKRRSRMSRRVPTTTLEASIGDFRDVVQRLTGIPAPSSGAPVRPQPQRAAPSTFIRPDRPRAADPSTSSLNFSPPAVRPASTLGVFADPLRPSHHQFSPLRNSVIKPQLEAPFSMTGSTMTTRILSAPITSSWSSSPPEQQSHHISFPSVVSPSSSVANEILGADRPSGVSSSLSELPVFQEDYMNQFDAWLSGEDH